jgi:hypothetical protein
MAGFAGAAGLPVRSRPCLREPFSGRVLLMRNWWDRPGRARPVPVRPAAYPWEPTARTPSGDNSAGRATFPRPRQVPATSANCKDGPDPSFL